MTTPVVEKKIFPTNPIQVLAINNAHCHDNVGGADLWTVDEIYNLPSMVYDYQIPTFTPRRWLAPHRVTQSMYDDMFAKHYPIAAEILRRVNTKGSKSIIVVGKAAASPYYEKNTIIDDSDPISIAVVGIDFTDKRALWAKVQQITRTLYEISGMKNFQNFFPGHVPLDLTQLMTGSTESGGSGGYLLSLRLQIQTMDSNARATYRRRKYRIIMRAYSSESAAIHTSDVGSLCISYDGTIAHATTLGAYAQLFRVNLVNPAYRRSITYEITLVDNFKLYALGLVHLKTGLLIAEQPLMLSYLVLTPALVRGNRATGVVEIPDTSKEKRDRGKVVIFDEKKGACVATAYLNMIQLAAGLDMYTIFRCTRGVRQDFHDLTVDKYIIPFEQWCTRSPMLEDLLSRACLKDALDEIIQTVYCSTTQSINARWLVTFLGMTYEEVTLLIRGILSLTDSYPECKINLKEALDPFRTEIIRRYEAAYTKPIKWWAATAYPDCYAATPNVCAENIASWYGEERVEASPGKVSTHIHLESLIGAFESLQLPAVDEVPVYDGNCAICFSKITRETANIVTLKCGHTFHWSYHAESDCGGFYRWMDEHTDCPTCRANYITGPSGKVDEAQDPPCVLTIDWPARSKPAADHDE